jgi:hypothetical protein
MAHSRAVSEQYEKIIPEYNTDEEPKEKVPVETKEIPRKTRSRMK